MLAAGAMIAPGKSEPGGKIPRAAEHPRIRHLGQRRARNHRADARHLHGPAGIRVGQRRLPDLPFQRTFGRIQRLPLLRQQRQRPTHELWDGFARRLELPDQLAQSPQALRRHDPKLAQHRP